MDHWRDEAIEKATSDARRLLLEDLRQIARGEVPTSWQTEPDGECLAVVTRLRTRPTLDDCREVFDATGFTTWPEKYTTCEEWQVRCAQFALKYLRRVAGVYEPCPLFDNLEVR